MKRFVKRRGNICRFFATFGAAAVLCGALAACAVTEQTAGGATTTTATQEQTATRATTLTQQITTVAQVEATVTQAETTVQTKAPTTTIAVQTSGNSPFAKVSAVAVWRCASPYNEENPGLTKVADLTGDQLAAITAALQTGEWEANCPESNWVKSWPVYAEQVLVVICRDGAYALHLYGDTAFAAWAKMPGEDYEAFRTESIIAYREGENRFVRGKLPVDVNKTLQALFA